MKLGIDLDGVVYNFVEDARNCIAAYKGIDPTTLPVAESWNFYNIWKISRNEFWDAITQGAKNGTMWANHPPIEGSIESLELLRDKGHTIHICTSRAGVEVETHAWARSIKLPYDTFTISSDKTIVNVDLFLDDFEVNWRELTDAGIPCVLFDQPWNRHVTEAERVLDWEHFVKYVEAASS